MFGYIVFGKKKSNYQFEDRHVPLPSRSTQIYGSSNSDSGSERIMQ
jgi:hypothetical protein